MSIQGRRVTHTLRVLKPRQRELMTQENWSIIFIMRSVHIYRAIYICFFQSYMISLRISRQFKTNTSQIKFIFWNILTISFPGWPLFSVHFINILRTLIIFSLFCLNAKIIHARFVTKKYKDLFKRENDKNKGMLRGDPQILLIQCF